MKPNYLISIFIFSTRILFSTNSPMDDVTNVKTMVRNDGYPFETHYVETEDGYTLEMHRIPGIHGSGGNEVNKYPVLIRHGLGECSALFLLKGPGQALAYLLADSGYDVWLGNARGSIFSRNHSTYLASSFGFWNFSWHEIGLYDDSAMIDYVLKETKNDKLLYVCHSQGCTELFVLISLKPEYNQKISLAVNLAPAIFMEHMSGIARLGIPFLRIASDVMETFGHVNCLDGSTWLRIVTHYFCAKGKITQPICLLAIYIIGGFSFFETDRNLVSKFLTFFPTGGSTKQLFHYGFGVTTPASFRQYDYGKEINKKIYNATVPPKYPLENAKLPVAIFYGSRDFLAGPKDIALLIKTLPKVIHSQLIQGYSHFDFLVGINVRKKVYEQILKLLDTYKNK